MNINYFSGRIAAMVLCMAFLISHAGVVAAQPGTSIKQGLVLGNPVSSEMQQKMGLVALTIGSGACSGSLLRPNWVLTAAHCVESGGRTVAADGVDINLRGTGRNQMRKSVEIITFRPNDVAIIRVETPFNGVDFANREVYTGDMTNMTIRMFGRGINEFSSNGNPSKMDDQYRDGVIDVTDTTSSTYSFDAKGGVMVAGGDSGGASFVKGRSSSAFGAVDMIAGVHSSCKTKCAEGKDCGSEDDPENPWRWVSSTPTCTDAAIGPLWPRISKLLEPSFQGGKFDTGGVGAADEFQTLYTVSQDGTLTWRRHYIRYPNGRNNFPTHTFSEPKSVGRGWAGGHRDVMAMGQIGIYSLLDDGTLRWNWHLGFNEGTFDWRDSLDLAKGLTGFKHVVAQDEGVIYGILPDGSILWGITTNYDKKKGTPSTSFPIRMSPVNINFNAFTRVFGGGKGVFYGVDRAGKLYWMKHNFYRSPMPDPAVKMPGSAEYAVWMNQWSGPVLIGSGLGTPENAFSPGDGHIYYSFLGQLFWDRHEGWENGTKKWGRGSWTTITGTSNWGNYKFAFARNTTSDLGSGNPQLEPIPK